jgi:hypothetical protein
MTGPEKSTQQFVYDDEPQGERMEFRLLYDGRLPSQKKGNARVAEKHAIRKVFHKQLAALWEQHPALQRLTSHGQQKEIAEEFSRSGFNFVPLINQKVGGAFAALDILFLRRDHPGNLVQSGDIDNRIKVLFDALKVPKYSSDIGEDVTPDEDETPFYCLLEDDALITSVNITTDRLLSPFVEGSHEHILSDVFLVIQVKTGVFNSVGMWSEAVDGVRRIALG